MTGVAAALAVVTAALAAPAMALAAGWTPAQAVQSGIDPILTFSPSGAAAIGSRLASHGRPRGADIDIATDGASFAASPYTLSAPSAGHGAEPLAGLALSSAGYLAAGFTAPETASPVLARVAPPAPSNFAKVQQLIPLGHADSGQRSADTLAMVATTHGELVGAGTDDAGLLYTATLTLKRTSFTTARGPSGFSATDAYALSADGSGDAFLAGDGADGCTTVAYRAPRATFRRTYATGNCTSATPNIFDAISATSHGYAGLLSEDVSESGAEPDRLLVQVGHDGHFGTATELGSVLGPDPVGLASDADGELTAEWTDCRAGPVQDGQLTTTACAIDAATGSVTHGFSPTAAAGTVLAPARTGTTLSALSADRGVAISRCAGAGCTFSASTAESGGRFRAAHTLGRGRQLISLTGDGHGDLLAVWADAGDHLYAATASAATGRWSPAHRLSAAAVSPVTVTAAYGPRKRAIVAWSVGNRTYAAGFTL